MAIPPSVLVRFSVLVLLPNSTIYFPCLSWVLSSVLAVPVTAGSIEAKTFLLDVILPSIESNLDEAISERSDVFHSMLLEADDVWGEAVSTGNSQFFGIGQRRWQSGMRIISGL